MTPLLLHGVPKRYPWGSHSFIQNLVGEPDEPGPLAELWFGTHKRGPAWVPEKQTDLSTLIEGLPYLVKILAAETPLSIQCHPNKAQARAGYKREQALGLPVDSPQRLYPDESNKPELLVALSPFEALKGFRAFDEARQLLSRWAPSALESLAAESPPTNMESLFRGVLSSKTPLTADEKQLANGGDDPLAPWLRELSTQYPGDPLQLAPLLLNYMKLEPGEAIFLPAGQPHAYLRGAGVEVMASSDNVLRCGLTPKHVDKDEMLSVLDFRPHSAEPTKTVNNGGAIEYQAETNAFTVRSICLGAEPFAMSAGKTPTLLLCTEGKATLSANETTLAFSQGEACLIPTSQTAEITGPATLYVVFGEPS